MLRVSLSVIFHFCVWNVALCAGIKSWGEVCIRPAPSSKIILIVISLENLYINSRSKIKNILVMWSHSLLPFMLVNGSGVMKFQPITLLSGFFSRFCLCMSVFFIQCLAKQSLTINQNSKINNTAYQISSLDQPTYLIKICDMSSTEDELASNQCVIDLPFHHCCWWLQVEHSLPQQYLHNFKNGEFTTAPVSHSGA